MERGRRARETVDLKYKSPLVKQCTFGTMTGLYQGVDTPTMQSYNPFRGLHLICATPMRDPKAS